MKKHRVDFREHLRSCLAGLVSAITTHQVTPALGEMRALRVVCQQHGVEFPRALRPFLPAPRKGRT